MTLLALLDTASVVIFALTGALVASRAQLDIFGFAFVACLTAVGGGTLRDLLLDRHPIFWIDAPAYILWSSAAAAVIFGTAHLLESRKTWVIWLDSFALAVAVPAGVAATLETTQHPVIVVLMGIATGTFGGLMRDVVCNEVPLVLKQGELYMSCALAGASMAILALYFDINQTAALCLCAFTTWSLRAGSIAFGWHIPVYKSRPARD